MDFTVNKAEFDKEMTEQRNRSKSAALVESADWVILRPGNEQTEFMGYDHLRAEVKINRFRKGDTKR